PAFRLEPACEVVVDEARGGVLLAQHEVREGHVHLTRPEALEGAAVVVDPVDAHAGAGEASQVSVGLRLAPRDVGDPELVVAPGPVTCITERPRATSASAMSCRWHRHGTASAQSTAVGRAAASARRRARPARNSALSMWSA